MDKKSQIAAVVVNETGDILSYTTRSTMSQCEEAAQEHFGAVLWARLKGRGAQVVQCEITLLTKQDLRKRG